MATDLKGVLTNKIGPLPAWLWGAGIGGGIITWRIVSGKDEEDKATSNTADPGYADPDGMYSLAGNIRPMPDSYVGGPTIEEIRAIVEGEIAPIRDELANPPDPLAPVREAVALITEVRDSFPTSSAAPVAPSDPVPPPEPVAAPAPPRPTYLPTLGPWDAEPNAARKASLRSRGYRVVRRGDGKWIAVDINFHT